jgi:hypothetical protein
MVIQRLRITALAGQGKAQVAQRLGLPQHGNTDCPKFAGSLPVSLPGSAGRQARCLHSVSAGPLAAIGGRPGGWG